MPGAFLTDDLSGMLLATDFGTAVTYNNATIYCIFDREYTTVEVGNGEVGFESSTPIIYARHEDVSAATQGDRLTVDNVRYVVDQVENDRTGMVLLRLSLTDADQDWGSVAGVATTAEDWGSVATTATSTNDWGSVE